MARDGCNIEEIARDVKEMVGDTWKRGWGFEGTFVKTMGTTLGNNQGC